MLTPRSRFGLVCLVSVVLPGCGPKLTPVQGQASLKAAVTGDPAKDTADLVRQYVSVWVWLPCQGHALAAILHSSDLVSIASPALS